MKQKSAFSTLALIMGIIGICLSFIPIINNASFFLGVLVILFSIIAFKRKSSKTKTIIALILGVLSIVITLSLQSSWAKSIDESLGDTMGSNTEKILKNDILVEIGDFVATQDEYGLSSTKLVVKVTNKSSESKSYDIEIEAVDKSNTRIDSDNIYVSSLASGQSQQFEIFTLVSEEKIEQLKTSTFKIVKVSKY